MAALVHDDIVGDSPLRRDTMTIQSQYDKDVVVYTGNLLFTEFFTSIAGAMNGSRFVKVSTQGMRRLSFDGLGQMGYRFDCRMSTPAYLGSVNGKITELFPLSCLERAYLSHSLEEV